MLNALGLLVFLFASVVSIVPHALFNTAQTNHCLDGSNVISSDESIIGLSCINLNCSSSNEIKFCWGSTFCQNSYGSSCKLLDGLFCQTEGVTSNIFKVCNSKPLEISVVNDLSNVMQSLTKEISPSKVALPGVGERVSTDSFEGNKIISLSKILLF
jgi:hypothetical protein